MIWFPIETESLFVSTDRGSQIDRSVTLVKQAVILGEWLWCPFFLTKQQTNLCLTPRMETTTSRWSCVIFCHRAMYKRISPAFVYEDVCAYVLHTWRTEVNFGFFRCCKHLLFGDRVSHWPGDCQIGWAWASESQGLSSVVLGLQAWTTTPGFLCGWWGIIMGPHVCTVSTVPMKSSPLP